MPIFDIDYAKAAPTNEPGSVRARMDTDTGAGAVWGAITKAGETMQKQGMQVLQALQDAEDTVALDTLKRQRTDKYNDLQRQLAQTRDPAVQRAATDAFYKDVDEMKPDKDPWGRLTPRWQHEQASFMPQAKGQIEMKLVQTRLDNTRDDFQLNYAAKLKSGDQAGANAMIDASSAIFSPGQIAAMKKNFPTDSAITQAHDALLTGHPADIAAKVAALDGISGTTVKQDEDIYEVKQFAKTQTEKVQKEQYVATLGQIEDLWDMEPSAALGQIQTLRADIKSKATQGVFSESQREHADTHLQSVARQIASGTKTKANERILGEAWKQAKSINKWSDPKDVDAAEQYAQDNIESLGTQYHEIIKDIATKRTSEETNDWMGNIKVALGDYQLKNPTQRFQEAEHELKGKNAKDTYVGAQTLAAKWKSEDAAVAAAKPMYTPAKMMALKVQLAEAKVKTDTMVKVADDIGKYTLQADTAQEEYDAAKVLADELPASRTRQKKMLDAKKRIDDANSNVKERKDLLEVLTTEHETHIKSIEDEIKAGTPASATTQPAKSLPTVTTQEEYDSLKIGDQYLDSKGIPRTKT